MTEPITEVRPDGVVTADGSAHAVDTIILGTGFNVTDKSVMQHVTGRDGRTLAEAWSPTMRAYLGTTVAGFPNLFVLLGPEHRAGSHVGRADDREPAPASARRTRAPAPPRLRRDGANRGGTAPLDRLVDQRMAGTVWAQGGCMSWYLDANGRNSTLWPGYATGFRLRLGRFRPGDYTVTTGILPAVEVLS